MKEQKKDILISVIVPIYNAERYLNQCLTSIQNQIFQAYEVILVNDGSTDESQRICQQFCGMDERFQLLTQSNQGLSVARNAGIEQSVGTFICFIDADDVVSPQLLQAQYENIKCMCADIAICNYVKIQRNQEYTFATDSDTEYQEVSKRELLMDLSTTGPDNKSERIVVAWNKLYDRRVFGKIRYPEHMWHEDEYIIHNLIDAADKIIMTEQVLYGYRQHEDSFMQKANTVNDGHMDLLKALENRLRWIEERNDGELLHAVIISILENATFLYLLAESEELRKKRKKVIRQKMWRILMRFWNIMKLREICRYSIFFFSPLTYKRIFWNQ